MKPFIPAFAIAAVIVAPVASFAQSNAPLTRAQVRAEMVQLENVGYNPSHIDDAHYPDDVLAAQAKVAAQKNAVGGAANGSSDSGSPLAVRPAY
ncbi:DUF4148 domain-containing protein [Paraburkholderia tagetis]|uniref:DUF4148 domain-containing protein n=1 Tax=Paraburkholderia tagetis TaxID=2913261 RepID=UPI003B75BFE8